MSLLEIVLASFHVNFETKQPNHRNNINILKIKKIFLLHYAGGVRGSPKRIESADKYSNVIPTSPWLKINKSQIPHPRSLGSAVHIITYGTIPEHITTRAYLSFLPLCLAQKPYIVQSHRVTIPIYIH